MAVSMRSCCSTYRNTSTTRALPASCHSMKFSPLPPIPMQLEPSNGIPRRSQREPGAWCRENGVTPPPGSFEENMTMTTGA